MDAQAITTIVSNLGFPIAMCIILFAYVIFKDKKHTDEVAQLRTAIDNNTAIMLKLYEKLSENQNDLQ